MHDAAADEGVVDEQGGLEGLGGNRVCSCGARNRTGRCGVSIAPRETSGNFRRLHSVRKPTGQSIYTGHKGQSQSEETFRDGRSPVFGRVAYLGFHRR